MARGAWMTAVTVAAAVAMLLPPLRDPPRDSFPLSTYPMFSWVVEPVRWVDLAVGLDVAGADVTLDPDAIGGTDEVIVAGSTVRQAVRNGRSDELCREIAERVADDGPSSVTAIEIRSDQIDARRWYDGDRTPLDRAVRASCEVPS